MSKITLTAATIRPSPYEPITVTISSRDTGAERVPELLAVVTEFIRSVPPVVARVDAHRPDGGETRCEVKFYTVGPEPDVAIACEPDESAGGDDAPEGVTADPYGYLRDAVIALYDQAEPVPGAWRQKLKAIGAPPAPSRSLAANNVVDDVADLTGVQLAQVTSWLYARVAEQVERDDLPPAA